MTIKKLKNLINSIDKDYGDFRYEDAYVDEENKND